MNVEEIEAKSLVRMSGPSIFSWAEIYLNPYQGCFHDCKYCDGNSEHYHMHDDFSGKLKVKINAPQLFEKFLKSKGFNSVHRKEQYEMFDFFPGLKEDKKRYRVAKSIINIGGGVCDVYQPLEEEVKMTRKLLEIVYDYQMPLWILTKNDLVLRDIDLIKEINKETYACVNFTITLANEREQKIFEPGASTTEERFQAIKEFRKAGIHSGVYFYPTLPFIGDTEENIKNIYERAKKVDTEFIFCGSLTLKPGRNKNEFLQTIKQNFPQFLSNYEILYGNNNKYGMLDIEKFNEFNLVWPEIKGFKYGYELGLDFAAERYVPDGRLFMNLKISELFRKITYIQNSFLNESKYIIQAFSMAAQFIEKSTKDFALLSDDDYDAMPVADYVKLVIKEYIKNNSSDYLNNLENLAYNKILEKYY
ncbi:MAG: radical SAM protein [Candidatus Thorarchaeota archaeon]